MMSKQNLFRLFLYSLLLTGCAGFDPHVKTQSAVSPLPWHDADFSYSPDLIKLRKVDLFYLDSDIREKIRQAVATDSSRQNKMAQMLELIFGSDAKSFFYFTGHSTIANETWNNKRGDCISLTILAYAIGKEMNLPVTMQQVRSVATFDRRQQIDFINEHVNLVIQNNRPFRTKRHVYPGQNIVVDFDPDGTAASIGTALTEDGITARFYNNLGAEYLAQGNPRLAYAYFKTAMLIDPTYSDSYSNMAQLYLDRHLQTDAESLLRYALAVTPNSYITLISLKKLMREENREEEEKIYAAQLRNLQDNDPYYWIGLGAQELVDQQTDAAIESLEKAASLAKGFEEIHAWLAQAYRRANQFDKAQAQLKILKSINPNNALLQQYRAANAKQEITPNRTRSDTPPGFGLNWRPGND